MAHFAKLNEENIVIAVNAVNNKELLDENGVEQESKGIDFLKNWSNGYENWKQTSYNANFRKHYAGIGYKYDAQLDAFVPPQPYPSWTLDADANWQAPVAMPTDGGMYSWNEANQAWEATNGT